MTTGGSHVVIGGDSLANLDTIRGSNPRLRFEETDQVDPAGYYQIGVNGDVLTISRAATAGWATLTELLRLDENAGATFLELSGANTDFRLTNTSETDPVGRWRFQALNGSLRLQRRETADTWTGARTILSIVSGGTVVSDNQWNMNVGLDIDIADTTGNADNTGVDVFYTRTVTAGNANVHFGGSFVAQGVASGGAQTFSASIGLIGVNGGINAGTGSPTINAAAAIRAQSPQVAGAAVITDAYGLYVASASVTGTLTNFYGIRVEDTVAGTIGVSISLGTIGDIAITHRNATLAANTALAGVLIGTPVTPVALAGDSLIISAITASGDILLAVNKGGTSYMAFMADASTGDTLLGAPTGQSIDQYIAGVKEIDYATGALAFQQATTITTTAGNLILDPAGNVQVLGNMAVAGQTPDDTVGFRVGNVSGASGLYGILISTTFSPTAAGLVLHYYESAGEVATGGNAVSAVRQVRYSTLTKTGVGVISKLESIHFQVQTIATNNSAITIATGWTVPAVAVDEVQVVAFDIAPGDARWAFVSEVGSPIYIGNDILRFAATTGIIGIGATTVLSSTATLVTLPVDVLASVGVRIGADSTNNEIDDATQGAASTALFIGNGQITVVSDVRVKFNIMPYVGDALSLFRQMNVVEYDMAEANKPFGGVYDGQYVGMTAQELYKTVPWAINTQGGKDCWECKAGLACNLHLRWQVKYALMAGLFVKGFQEVGSELQSHEARITELEAKVLALGGTL